MKLYEMRRALNFCLIVSARGKSTSLFKFWPNVNLLTTSYRVLDYNWWRYICVFENVIFFVIYQEKRVSFDFEGNVMDLARGRSLRPPIIVSATRLKFLSIRADFPRTLYFYTIYVSNKTIDAFAIVDNHNLMCCHSYLVTLNTIFYATYVVFYFKW